MSKILQKIEENEREFDKKFGTLQVMVDSKKIADVNATPIIKSFFRDSQIKLLEKVVEEIEKTKQPIAFFDDQNRGHDYGRGFEWGFNKALFSLQETIKGEIKKI